MQKAMGDIIPIAFLLQLLSHARVVFGSLHQNKDFGGLIQVLVLT
jgi:hypothetical protein